jgi:hypothetical protein
MIEMPADRTPLKQDQTKKQPTNISDTLEAATNFFGRARRFVLQLERLAVDFTPAPLPDYRTLLVSGHQLSGDPHEN